MLVHNRKFIQQLLTMAYFVFYKYSLLLLSPHNREYNSKTNL